MRLTASSIWLAKSCGYPFSDEVGQIRSEPNAKMARGTAIHKVNECLVVSNGADHGPTWDALDEDDRKGCLRSFAWQAEIAPPEWRRVTEVCYGYSPFAGAECFESAKARDYSALPDDYLPGTSDLVIHGPTQAIVADWKTGKSSAIDHTHQLNFLAMCVVLAHGYESAVCYVPKVGPRSHKPKGWVVTREDAERIAAETSELLFSLPNARPQMNEACRYCNAGRAGVCPEMAEAFKERDEEVLNYG